VQKIDKNKILRLLKAAAPWAIFFVLLLFTLKAAHAQSYLGTEWDRYLQNVRGFTPTSQSGEELAISFVLNLIRIVRNVVGAAALIMGVLYGVRLVISRGQEDVISKQKTNFLYALLGFIILIISENVALILNPERATTDQLIDFDAARDQLRDIVDYMKWLLGSVAVLMFAISALRLVVAQGEDEELTAQKRNMTWSLLGLLVVLLASNIVNAIYVIRSPAETAAAAPESAITEFAGVIRLILVFLGPAAIAFTIYAGFMYLTALDNEERATKAKRMIVEGVVAIVVIYGAFALVSSLTSAELGLIGTFVA
jgi:hypothetical protein